MKHLNLLPVIAILILLIILVQNGISSELVAYYPFNGNANDESGSGNDGTAYGAVLTSDRFGNSNSAFSFNSTENDYIEIPHSDVIDFGTDQSFSLVAWIKTNMSGTGAIINKHVVSSGPTHAHWKILIYNNGTILFGTETGSKEIDVKENNNGNGWNDDQWHIVIAVRDCGSHKLKLYVDRNDVAEENEPIGRSISNSGHVVIGQNAKINDPNDNYQKFNGIIDDVRIYNRALTEEEIHDLQVPVELTAFTATVSDGEVILNWTTQTETENYGFHVYRSLFEDRDYVKITQSIIPGAGSSEVIHNYSYTDATVERSKTYYYKLAALDYNGNVDYHGPITAIVTGVRTIDNLNHPDAYVLEQNYPNPFNPETAINFSIKEAGEVSLKIYNLQGQLVRTLADEEKPAGNYSVMWNGTDEYGNKVTNGIFPYCLKINGFEQVRKLTLIK